METKFTPGPWGCVDHGVGELVVYEVDGDNALCIFDGFEGLIAWKDGYSTSDEAEANAHLISAAPDLYEALNAMLEDYEDASDEWDNENREIAYKIIYDARKALAKAMGEEK